MLINKILRLESLAVACLMMSLSVAVEAKKEVGPEVRTTVYGDIIGVNDQAKSGTLFWQGVPFAKPPVGALRWRAPVEPDAWKKPLSTKKFGNACIQNGRVYGPGLNNKYDETIGTTLNTPVGHEDCLTLNIWRPATPVANLPVLVFVYGGSNISGYSADPVYNGANLAKKANAVVVTMNYRMGVMGFLNMSHLKTGTDAVNDSGNFAILDILQSLKFINKNIANFGGDSNNVTLMGQSAGAVNVWAIVASPLGEGLVHKAIPMSGGISLPGNLPKGSFPTLLPPSFYGFQSNTLLNILLIDDGKATDNDSAKAYLETQSKVQIAEYLRSKDAKVILKTVLTKLGPRGMAVSGPIPDGTVVPPDPISAFASGNYRKIPILVTDVAEEGKLFAALLALSPAVGGKNGFIIDDATRFKIMAKYDGDAPYKAKPVVGLKTLEFFPFDGVPQDELMSILRTPAATATGSLSADDLINPAYLPLDAPTTGWNARTKYFADIFLNAARTNVLESLIKSQPNVYYSQFRWKQEPAPWNEVFGAAHLFDMPFVFGNFGPAVFSKVMFNKANKNGREELSDAMMDSIGAFAKNGDPNTASLGVTWEPWPKKVIFDATLTKKKITAE